MTAAGVVALLAVVAAVGVMDLKTGVHLGFGPFYLVPIAAAAWFLGRGATALAVAASVAAWFMAEYGWEHDYSVAMSAWNAGTRAVTFSIVGFLIVHLRAGGRDLVAARDALARALERERELSRTDALTGLANRRAFVEALERAVARGGRDVTVAYLDVDNFKAVNDRFGHDAGDGLLREVAGGLARAVRDGDVAARLGGDEFAVLFTRTPSEHAHTALRRLLAVAAGAAARLPGTEVGMSIGVVHWARLPETVEGVLRRADAAMYRAKREGKGRIVAEWDDGTRVEAAAVGARVPEAT